MEPERILESVRDLEGYFDQGSKSREDWGVGIEYERLGVFSESGRAAPYHGPRSVSALLARLVSAEGWRPIYSGAHIIALERDRTRITLEPGGQLELSGAVHRRLDDLLEEVGAWTEMIREHSEPLGISWLGLGLQPFTPLDDIEWIPKPRYTLMSAHLARTGSLGHVMMKQTAGVQVNLDYADEQDAFEKFRAAMGLTSLVTAIFANSPLTEGRPNGQMSYRSWVWQNTDPSRCGLLALVFEPQAGFGDYLEYALGVPTMFILRKGSFVDMRGIPFGEFLRSGSGEHRATFADFQLHLTTLFPEVRLKHHLEIRGGDSGDPNRAVAQVAFWKGIFYDAAALREAWSLVSDLSFEERLDFHREACRLGTEARLQGRSALEIGADLHRIASAGLDRQGEPRELLEPMGEILFQRRVSPAKALLGSWLGEWNGNRRRLVEACSRINVERPRASGDVGAEDY